MTLKKGDRIKRITEDKPPNGKPYTTKGNVYVIEGFKLKHRFMERVVGIRVDDGSLRWYSTRKVKQNYVKVNKSEKIMTQRKPSDERIERRADRAAYIKTGDTPEEFEPYKAGFIYGAAWYRDHDPWIYLSDTNNPVNRSEELSEGTYVIQTVYGDMRLTKYEPRIDCFALLNKSISAIPGNEVYACLPIDLPQK